MGLQTEQILKIPGYRIFSTDGKLLTLLSLYKMHFALWLTQQKAHSPLFWFCLQGFLFFYVIFLYGHFSLNTEHIVKSIFSDSIIFYHNSDKERFLLY